MVTQLRLADLDIEVIQKDIKNVHLSVYPPDGHVRVSVPRHMPLDTLRAFLVTKVTWIRDEQRNFRAQERREPPLYIDRESHYIWGERYLLQVVERDAPPSVELGRGTLTLAVRPGSDAAKRDEVLAFWYRDRVREVVGELLPVWERRIGIKADKIFVQRMKTKWGSCNPRQRAIRLNTELAKRPRTCLEYILVHELMHLHEPTHNTHFRDLMDLHMPTWRDIREELNRQPLSSEEWGYCDQGKAQLNAD